MGVGERGRNEKYTNCQLACIKEVHSNTREQPFKHVVMRFKFKQVIVTVLDNQLSDVNMPAWQVLAKMNNNGSEVLLRNIEQCAFYLSSYNNASVSLWKPSIGGSQRQCLMTSCIQNLILSFICVFALLAVMQAMRVNVTAMSEDVDFPSKEVALMSSFPLTASIRTPVALLKERANRSESTLATHR